MKVEEGVSKRSIHRVQQPKERYLTTRRDITTRNTQQLNSYSLLLRLYMICTLLVKVLHSCLVMFFFFQRKGRHTRSSRVWGAGSFLKETILNPPQAERRQGAALHGQRAEPAAVRDRFGAHRRQLLQRWSGQRLSLIHI